MVWVVRIIDEFLFLVELEKLFHRYLLEIGSTPDEGSSKNMTLGFPSIAILTTSFLLFPPLRFPALTLVYFSNANIL